MLFLPFCVSEVSWSFLIVHSSPPSSSPWSPSISRAAYLLAELNCCRDKRKCYDLNVCDKLFPKLYTRLDWTPPLICSFYNQSFLWSNCSCNVAYIDNASRKEKRKKKTHWGVRTRWGTHRRCTLFIFLWFWGYSGIFVPSDLLPVN